ncbi:LysR substrate-binding domain-containing protein [Brachybacterium subflavum]|uniref:LysR substrate-binding domain-containing protein n=1 Tax=Brachybacterium subflavum TaxID=2585206 RepID=UPI0012662FAC|nr:LysR substrate-binding domain-containing protein [Brachybacterium subflavum]
MNRRPRPSAARSGRSSKTSGRFGAKGAKEKGRTGRSTATRSAAAPSGGASAAPASPDAPAEVPVLRVGYVPGVEPDRFARRWRSGRRPARLELVPVPLSRQSEALGTGEIDMCFVRLPLATEDDLHLVELWEERPMVVVGTENILSLHEELTAADLAEDPEIRSDHPDDAADRVAVVATGIGHVRLPMSLARLHHRKDVVHRPLADATATRIALAWPRAADDAARQEFVGTVRGRTARSSR